MQGSSRITNLPASLSSSRKTGWALGSGKAGPFLAGIATNGGSKAQQTSACTDSTLLQLWGKDSW